MLDRRTVRTVFQAQWQVVEVVVHVDLLLRTGFVELLPEVTLLVQQADPDNRKPQVAGGFEVIAGQESESSGKDGQALGQPELSREVRNQRAGRRAVRPREPGGRIGQIGLKSLDHTIDVGHETGISRG